MRPHPRWLVAVLGVWACGVLCADAVEPFGHVVWGVVPDAEEVVGPSPRLRLRISAVSPLLGAELRIRTPEGISVVPVPLAGSAPTSLPASAADGALLLGDLERGATVPLDFEISIPRGVGGIAGFTITARLPNGRSVEESFGWTLAEPRGPPTHRFGAVEYPAVLLPEEGR